MTDRITLKQVEGSIEHLNKISKRQYRLDGAYGGHKLIVTYQDSSGISEVSFGYDTKSNLYYTIQTIIRYVYHEKNSPFLERKD